MNAHPPAARRAPPGRSAGARALRAAAAVLFVASCDCSGAPRAVGRPIAVADGPGAPSPPTTTVPATPSGLRPIAPADLLYASASSGHETAARLVVRDPDEWLAVWRRLHGDQQADQPPPVDFTRAVVAVIALGERPSGGHAVRVDGSAEAGGEVVVYATAVAPGPTCMTTQQITAPAVAARVGRGDGRVRIELRRETRPC